MRRRRLMEKEEARKEERLSHQVRDWSSAAGERERAAKGEGGRGEGG